MIFPYTKTIQNTKMWILLHEKKLEMIQFYILVFIGLKVIAVSLIFKNKNIGSTELRVYTM